MEILMIKKNILIKLNNLDKNYNKIIQKNYIIENKCKEIKCQIKLINKYNKLWVIFNIDCIYILCIEILIFFILYNQFLIINY